MNSLKWKIEAARTALALPILNSLDPKFATVIQTFAEDQRQSHWYQVWDEHNRHNDARIAINRIIMH